MFTSLAIILYEVKLVWFLSVDPYFFTVICVTSISISISSMLVLNTALNLIIILETEKKWWERSKRMEVRGRNEQKNKEKGKEKGESLVARFMPMASASATTSLLSPVSSVWLSQFFSHSCPSQAFRH